MANQLLADGNLDKVGGADYLHSLVASVPTAANAMYYAEIVHQRAILRNADRRRHQNRPARLFRRGIARLRMWLTSPSPRSTRCQWARCVGDYAAIARWSTTRLTSWTKLQQGLVNKGVPTGFRDIDDVTQGLRPDRWSSS